MWVKLMVFAFLMYQVQSESVNNEYKPIFEKLIAEIEATAANDTKLQEKTTSDISQSVAKIQVHIDFYITLLQQTVEQGKEKTDKNIDACIKRVNETIATVSVILNPCLEPHGIKLIKQAVANVSRLSREVQRKRNSCVRRYLLLPNKLRNCFDQTIAHANQVLTETEEAITTGLNETSTEVNGCIILNLGIAITTIQDAQNSFNRCVKWA